MKRLNIKIGIILLSSFVALLSAHAADVYASDGGKSWTDWSVKTLRPARNVDVVNKYGGSKKHKSKASGYFHVIKKSNRWWIVDPSGGLFIMKGVNSVQAKRIDSQDEEQWAKDTYALLTGAGFNTIGRWSDPELFEAVGMMIPWCSTTSFIGDYAKRRPAENGESRYPNETLPVFDKEWPAFCEQYAQKNVAKFSKDPWLLGHFSDNEIPFRPDALSKYLALPKNDVGRKAAAAWMRENKVRASDVDDKEVQAAFLEVVARRYFETVAAAVKKADPNHMYIGSRLHGRCISEPVIRAAGACDLISINYYHRWEPEVERMKNWEKWSKSPFFVSEFYAMRVASEETVPEGVGFRVLNFDDAAAFYHTHTSLLLKKVPSCVGWHWFKYADDTPEWQKGIVGNEGKVHEPLVRGMKTLNDQAYSLRGLR